MRTARRLESVAARGEGALLQGRYRLGRVLGAGGEADVHLARDEVLGRDVAVKLFRPQTVSVEHRFEQLEARVAASLNHYALTTLLDTGIHRSGDGDAQVLLVMEYVQGESLRDRLRRGPMSVAEVCWLAFDLAEGLDHMHQSGFLHRDVKPANVLISGLRSVRPVVAKLTDFGIAARVGERDVSEFTVGSAAYLSPEQVEGHDAGIGSDVYSLGLVMLEAITGRIEFPGGVEQSAFERLVRDPRIPETVPAPVADLLRRMTARRPADRVDLHRVAVELQQFLAGELLRAQQTSASVTATPATASVAPATSDVVLRLVLDALQVPQALLAVDRGDGEAALSHLGFEDEAAAAAASWRLRASGGVEGDAPGEGVAGAATTPLLVRGRRVGRLTALAEDGREFTPEQLRVLAGLAALIVNDIELRAATRQALFGDG